MRKKTKHPPDLADPAGVGFRITRPSAHLPPSFPAARPCTRFRTGTTSTASRVAVGIQGRRRRGDDRLVLARCVFDWKISEAAAGCRRRSPDGRSFAQAEVRKVRTPQGNAPHESEGREPRGTRTDSAAERYRRWPDASQAQARVKWWSKSPPRIRVTGRHGKPRVVQDRTGEGLPAR